MMIGLYEFWMLSSKREAKAQRELGTLFAVVLITAFYFNAPVTWPVLPLMILVAFVVAALIGAMLKGAPFERMIPTTGATVLGMGLIYLVPPLVALSLPLHGDGLAALLAALAWGLMALAVAPTLRLYDQPLVLAPLLLTLAVAWGLSSAGRGVVRACDLTDGRSLAAVVAAAAGTHTLLTVLIGLLVDAPVARVDLLRSAVGSAVLAVLG